MAVSCGLSSSFTVLSSNSTPLLSNPPNLPNSVHCSSSWLLSQSRVVLSTQSRPRSLSAYRHICNCLPSSSTSRNSDSASRTKTRLYVSGLSFRTTEEGLRNAFQNFGELVEVNLVMDRIAKRPRGFAFLRYATDEESEKAIEGMHGKFLDGRVIFVEVAKPRSELRQGINQNSTQY